MLYSNFRTQFPNSKFSLLIFLFFFHFTALSQRATVSGYLYDVSSGERLISANIYDAESFKGTTTNNYGFYSLTLPKGEKKLTFSFVGFRNKQVVVDLQKDTTISIGLELNEAIEEILVLGESARRIDNTEMSMIDLPMQQVQKIPLIMGEPDLLKVIQLLPGVQSGTEGTSGIYVRGGGPDQNLFLLDGVPIYNVNHLFGFFSVFNPSAIKTVKLYKGGFPARFGGRLSSVIDISMKEGNLKRFEGEASIGLISSRLSFEGPIIKDKTSFIISGRRTYADVMMKPLLMSMNTGNDKLSAGYYFYDLNGKINHIFSERSRLYLSGYLGLDKFYMKSNSTYSNDETKYDYAQSSNISWGNGTGTLRWNYLISNKLFSNVILTYSNYDFNVWFDNKVENITDNKLRRDLFEYFSGIEDYSAKAEFDFFPIPQHSIKFGVGYINHTFNPGANHFEITDEIDNSIGLDTIFDREKINAHDFFAFFEDNIDISETLKLNAGLHFSGFLVEGVFYPSVEPRISMRYKFSDNFSAKASYSRMSQNIHLLSSSTISLPTDLWLPTTKKVKPQMSDQYAIGAFVNLPLNFELSVEGYYKTMTNLIEYIDGASYTFSQNSWEDQIELGNGWSYGAEILLEKKVGKTTGWIGYTLSWTERQFENLNFRKPFYARYDRRHDISIIVSHEFSKKIDAAITWVYGTGNAVTLGKQKYKQLENLDEGYYTKPITYYESRNNYRMPAYHRLDIGVNFHKKLSFATRTISISAYNAYNRLNPFYLYWGYKDPSTNKPVDGYFDVDFEPALIQLSIFPLIPSISYTLKF
jgi:outer membrane receptor for ferrienterochelin and colicin